MGSTKPCLVAMQQTVARIVVHIRNIEARSVHGWFSKANIIAYIIGSIDICLASKFQTKKYLRISHGPIGVAYCIPTNSNQSAFKHRLASFPVPIEHGGYYSVL